MLILECSQGCYRRTDGRTEGRKDGRTDGSVTISLRNLVGEGIKTIPNSAKGPDNGKIVNKLQGRIQDFKLGVFRVKNPILGIRP